MLMSIAYSFNKLLSPSPASLADSRILGIYTIESQHHAIIYATFLIYAISFFEKITYLLLVPTNPIFRTTLLFPVKNDAFCFEVLQEITEKWDYVPRVGKQCVRMKDSCLPQFLASLHESSLFGDILVWKNVSLQVEFSRKGMTFVFPY
jgi:hypothetical protein